MISDQITALITQAKQHPNGESRNSMISRLKDARAHAFVMEREEFLKTGGLSVDKIFVDEAKDLCICPAPGARAKNCTAPVHK